MEETFNFDELVPKVEKKKKTKKVAVKEDPLRDKVLDLRGKGYNDNQIASMLLIHKHKIEEIK